SGWKVQRVLPALRPQPEPVLAAHDGHVRLTHARRHAGAMDVAEARALDAVGRARHDTALIPWRDGDLRPAVHAREQDDLRVRHEKRQIGSKGAHIRVCGGRRGRRRWWWRWRRRLTRLPARDVETASPCERGQHDYRRKMSPNHSGQTGL